MKRAFILAAVGAWSVGHTATPITLTWTPPTANDDGSVPALVSGYDVWLADTDALLSALPDTQHGGKPAASVVGTTYTFPSLPPGAHFFAVSTWYCPPAGGACLVSTQSVHVNATVPAPVTTPAKLGIPGNVTISATLSAPQ